jgi:CBS domain-containing protein
MAQASEKKIRDLMTTNVVKIQGSASVSEAARHMRDSHIGAVVLEENGRVVGLLTDRDVAVRAVAEGRDPKSTRVADVATRDVVTLSPEDGSDRAIQIMRERGVRRVPVVENDRVVGIISLGDLAIERDRGSVLGQISAAPPTR